MVTLIICRLLFAYLLVLFVRIVLSWFPLEPGGTMATVHNFLYAVTEPVLAPVRRVLPPVGMGGMGFDLAPIVVILGIYLLQAIFC